MKIKSSIVFFITTFLLCLTGCQRHSDPNTVKIGTVAGPESELVAVAKTVAQNKYHLNIEIVEFNDYTTPNIALNDGSIDANLFQHQPYLDSEIKNRGFKLVSIGKTFIYPMGIYSKKIKNLNQVTEGALVAIPNDPSNEARALLLLQKANLIELKPTIGVAATTQDIIKNPKQLKFKELNAAQLVRALNDVTLAVINTNYAIPGGLSPSKDALFIEDKTSPYANILVVRAQDANDPKFKKLLEALQSPEVTKKAQALFGPDAIAAWN